MKKILLIMLCTLLVPSVILPLSGCSSAKKEAADQSDMKESDAKDSDVKDADVNNSDGIESDAEETGIGVAYRQISQDEAKEMMARDDGHIIVDVRRQDEYDAGHIPGAILIPNESIGDNPPDALPDYDQIILIYCRSGNRSKQASEKLAAMGYKNIYEFGGINTWNGQIVTGSQDAESTDQDKAEGQDVESTDREKAEDSEDDKEKQDMKLMLGETEVPVTWESNDSVDALKALAEEEPLTIQLSMYGGFEQVGPIGQTIVSNDRQTTTKAGDIVLYSGNQIVVFYGSNSWAYTRLGHIELTQKEMKKILENGDVKLTLRMDQ